MSVPYGPPTNIDLEAMNAMSKKVFGYEMGGYWYFLISEEAPSMLDRNVRLAFSHEVRLTRFVQVESAMSLFYSSSPGMWKDHLLPSGSLRDWVAQERVCEPPRYVSRSDFDMKKHRLLNDAFKLGGFQAPLNWYKSAIHRIDAKHEDALPIEQLVITLPVSVIAGQDDPLGRPDIALDAVEKGKQYLPDAKVETIKDASHWMMMEKPDETTLALIALANRAMHRGSRTQN
jgi:soluble epoxide hydrolase/lipid-phosphate phosphatase